jgi:adenylate cyclase
MPDVVWQHYTGNEPPQTAPTIQPIWLYGPPKSIPTYTLRDVFARDSKHPLPESLSSVAVFVGISDPEHPGTMDHYKIPIQSAEAEEIGGVELAATAFLNVLHGQELWRPGLLGQAAIVFLVALAAALSARVLPGRRGLIAIAALALAYGGLAWALFATQQVWLPFGVPIYLAMIAAVLLGLATRYAFARLLVERLTPQPVADILLEQMGTERREVHTEQATVMFTDVVGSVRLGDQLTNAEYTEVMNRYYDTATTTIEAHKGMVVEFMGDGILAVFSESVSGPDHATLACKAALALSEGIAEAPKLTIETGEVALRLRIGINTGMTATGDVGARHRFSYKVLGDTVNVASRLQEYGKTVDDGAGNVIMVSHVTRAMSDFASGRFDDLGAIPLRGKDATTGVAILRN